MLVNEPATGAGDVASSQTASLPFLPLPSRTMSPSWSFLPATHNSFKHQVNGYEKGNDNALSAIMEWLCVNLKLEGFV